MTEHDFSPLSDVCTACGAHISTAGDECVPSASEPSDAVRVLRRFMAMLDRAPRKVGRK